MADITILYAHRNRDTSRIKASLESLKKQTFQNFKVEFVDYGSDLDLATEVQEVISTYDFVNYTYYHTQNQPWNKSKALNSIIKRLQTPYCFIADVDMIFHVQFVETMISLQNSKRVLYFKVGYLYENEAKEEKKFEDYRIKHLSTSGATGMSLFPVTALQEVRGFDEFYHFWGSEDTDVHVRLRNIGIEVLYYDDSILLLHQWHPNYMSKEKKNLTKDLQITGAIQMNHQHLLFADKLKRTIVNNDMWGDIPDKKDFDALELITNELLITNEMGKIDDLLFAQLPDLVKKGVVIKIEEDAFQNSFKYRIKKLLGKKVPNYYSLKEINDKLLLHIISFYRNHPYSYRITDDLKTIVFTITK